jgi:Mg/Co/Ni transporter MgtE
MTYEEKCNFAIKELEAAKIWKSNYNPPIVKLVLSNALATGAYFGFVWGIFMYFFAWNTKNMSITAMLSTALFAGVFFGLSMASYYSYSFKKHELTPWHEMKNP